MPRLTDALQDAGVTVHADPVRTNCGPIPVDGYRARGRRRLDAAIAHINEYGTGHTEAIVTTDLAAAQRFTDRSMPPR